MNSVNSIKHGGLPNYDYSASMFHTSKRPYSALENTTNGEIKRFKILHDFEAKDEKPPVSQPHVNESFLVNEYNSIQNALQRSTAEPNLIGDFSRHYSMPLTSGRHQDLKAILPESLAQLLRGEYRNTIGSFKIIDCRYPYEYNGGHIMDAINLYSQEQCMDLLSNSHIAENHSVLRNILVFYCDFLSDRGSYLYRSLRNADRSKNASVYPSLNFPEIYILEGGYRNFFRLFPGMCVPEAHIEMDDPNHKDELRHFIQKTRHTRELQFRYTKQKKLWQ